MKRFFLFAFVLVSVLVLFVRAAGPDDQYVQIFKLIQEADQLSARGQADTARDKYSQAQTALKKLQESYPNWNESVVNFRLDYVASKIGNAATEKGRALATQKAGATNAPGRTQVEAQIQGLSEEVQRLRGVNAVLEAKLREALSAQPATTDPRELAKAEEKIRTLEKEREVLRISLQQEQSKQAVRAPQLEAADDPKKALAQANQKAAAQAELAKNLAREKEIIEARLQAALKQPANAKALQAENEKLKKEIANLQKARPTPASNGKADQELAAAKSNAQTNEIAVARLQSSLKKLQEENAALTKSKKELESKLAAAPAGRTSNSGEAKRLREERDDLLKKLNEAQRQLVESKAKVDAAARQQHEQEVKALRARLDVLEAQKVPYTSEELALFKTPAIAAKKETVKPGKKGVNQLPPVVGPLWNEAIRAFAARRFDEAEKKFQQVLQRADRNVVVLANLAAVQLQQNRLEAAEENLKRALALDGDDPRAIALFGYLKFLQKNYDDALNYLSRASQLDQKDPEIQNYLGITLSHKGQRAPAETAFRKAIQLEPGFGDAHQNLAVEYATQQPPFKELARWHYQKSLALGYRENPELEKLIESAPTATAPK